MAKISIDLDMKRLTNDVFVEKAKRLEPELMEQVIRPAGLVTIGAHAEVTARTEHLSQVAMKKGESVILDFGDHQVGYVTMKLKSVGSHQDAPVFIKLKFGEVAKELLEDTDAYDGWISKGWIQEEYLHLDVLPAVVELPRRYAFRFMEIHTIDTSLKYQLVVEDVTCKTVSAADYGLIEPLITDHATLKRIDEVSIRTLHNCMQSVFEDGPKRDRRLWIGDLRLQALANYATFKHYDLVKRCMYLFAGLTRDDGAVGACLFIEPEYEVDDTFFFDYSLFFVSVLKDYYEETKELETAEELWPAAYRQIELARDRFGTSGLVEETGDFWCFVDWKEGLDKQASANAIYLYVLNDAITLATVLGKTELAEELQEEKERLTDAVRETYWDETQQVFVSGQSRQISYASQVWMVLAGVVTGDKAAALMNRIMDMKPEMGMVTPYMNHHFVEALLVSGEQDKAKAYMEYYWGGMLEQGADTFWELYNPENPQESPYGSSMVNSCCHAWSCTPTYLLRRRF